MLIFILLSSIALGIASGFLRARGHRVPVLYWQTVTQPILFAVVTSGLVWLAIGPWRTGPPSSDPLRPAILGLLAGLLVATGGALKDTGWEPFSWLKFWRSPLIALAWGCILPRHGDLGPWWLTMLVITTCERFTVDDWKVLRGEMPSKFKNPNRDRGWILTRWRARS